MATLNRIQLLGNIGSVDIKEFNNGKIVNATLATSDRYTDREGNKQEETIWHRITFIGKLADIAPTMLHLMGLPVPEEMTGDVLAED